MPLQTRSENVESSWAPEDDAPVGNFDRSSIINNNLVLAKTETCAALPTIRAIHDGYEVYVE